MKKVIAIGAVTLISLGGFGIYAASPSSAQTQKASAILKGPDGTSIGKISFSTSRYGYGPTQVTVAIVKAPPGTDAKLDALHGIHIHANDDASNGRGCYADPKADPTTWFTSADGHYMKGDVMIGDMPNLILNKNGQWLGSYATDRFRVKDVIGKAVVVHAGPDNAGNIPLGSDPEQYTANSDAAKTKTSKTGNAGVRIACGVVVRPGGKPISSPPPSTTTTTSAPASTTTTTAAPAQTPVVTVPIIPLTQTS